MRFSIRRKLLISIAGIVLLFGAVLIMFNSTLLKTYYRFSEKQMLRKQAAVIESVIEKSAGDSELADGLEQIERRNNLTISLIGADGAPRYFTRMGLMDQPFGPPPEDNQPFEAKKRSIAVISSQQLPDGSVFELQKDHRLDISYMAIAKTLEDGSSLDVRVMLSSIERGAAVASTFTLYAVGIGLLAAALWAVSFSRKFTQPLVQMNGIARNISNLDFSEKCETRQADELGELGTSINDLSDRLSAALEDLKAKNALLEKELEHERQLDKMRKEFVANVSHELRTPISIIQGYADGLKMNIASEQAKRNYYSEVIMDEANRMNILVSDLLELSKYENGGAKLSYSAFDLSETVRKIAGRCIAPEMLSSVDFELVESAPSFADEKRIEQVLINYINNAVEHLAPGGRISISVSGSEGGESWILGVANDGEPIPEESLPYIWDSFYRADKARSREKGRYGLGLSIVRAIQKMHSRSYGARNLGGRVLFWAEVARQ